jgi:1-acyl-sn-glycerol-3-phosphate acyltransferase
MSLLQTAMGIMDTARISVPTVLDAALGRNSPERCDERLHWWGRKLLRDADVRLAVRGLEHLGSARESFIVMSNHQSLYDIPVLFCAIPRRIRMVAKAELFNVPVWGRAMHASGFVRVDRGNRKQAIESLRAGSTMLSEGTLLWIAPEGTRSPTGELGSFKSGGFHMALDTGYRILPVAIDGTRDVLKARGLVVRNGKKVVVTVLPPIDARAYGGERRKELMTAVRASIASALGQAPDPVTGSPRSSL